MPSPVAPAMPQRLLIFGLGYTSTRLAGHLGALGWTIVATRRQPQPSAWPILRLEDPAIAEAIAYADAILSSVPPDAQPDGPDPVLRQWADRLAEAPARWIGYLSSTGVYGDTGGRWVDETAPIGGGRRTARVQADLGWQSLAPRARAPVHIFRLPGIYGPGRSALDRARDGSAHRLRMPGPAPLFSRVHVDDIVGALTASLARPDAPGAATIYNIADDEPALANAVVEYACDLLGLPWPPLIDLDDPRVSDATRGFYKESRRVDNRRMKAHLAIKLQYPSYKEGLCACLEEETKP